MSECSPNPFSQPVAKHQARSFRNDRDAHARLVRALQRDFPARSQNELSEKIAEKLRQEGNPVTPRGVRNWLSEATTPHWRSVVGLMGILSDRGLKSVLQREDGE